LGRRCAGTEEKSCRADGKKSKGTKFHKKVRLNRAEISKLNVDKLANNSATWFVGSQRTSAGKRIPPGSIRWLGELMV
jgi:hypothetical protein